MFDKCWSFEVTKKFHIEIESTVTSEDSYLFLVCPIGLDNSYGKGFKIVSGFRIWRWSLSVELRFGMGSK